jgi:hypothetical protein
LENEKNYVGNSINDFDRLTRNYYTPIALLLAIANVRDAKELGIDLALVLAVLSSTPKIGQLTLKTVMPHLRL